MTAVWHFSTRGYIKPLSYILLNVGAGTSIIFANKVVLSVYHFHFVYALTLIHTVASMAGLWMFARVGLYEPKKLKALQTLPLALAFVGYVTLWNLSLHHNSVSFYQISKIMISPAIVLVEALAYQKHATRLEILSVMILCTGVGIATVAEAKVSTSLFGILLSALAIGVTSIYQIWAGRMQKAYQVNSMQLMENYTFYAAVLLCIILPFVESVGIDWPFNPKEDMNVFSFPYNIVVVGAIGLTAVLGLLVTWSTFLVIDATSTLTYSVVGNIKTIVILAGGKIFFNDVMPPLKLGAICLATLGIIFYSLLQINKSRGNTQSPPLTKQLEKDADSTDIQENNSERQDLIGAVWGKEMGGKDFIL